MTTPIKLYDQNQVVNLSKETGETSKQPDEAINAFLVEVDLKGLREIVEKSPEAIRKITRIG